MNRKIFARMFFSLAVLALPMLVSAQTQPVPKDQKDMANLPAADLNRIKIGEAAPDFTLEDQDGKPVTLSDYRGKKTVVLVFYRGYW